jgi:hypothetical protein
MAKSATPAQPSANEQDDLTPIDITKSEERWSEYTLTDGTVLRVKTVIADVLKSKTQYSPDGEPIYIVKGGMAVAARVPPRLRRSRG